MKLSITIPAFSEEAWLAAILDALEAAAARLRTKAGVDVATMAVDNNRADRTDGVLVRGPTPVCRVSALVEFGDYHEQTWIGEDVDFLRSLKRLAAETGREVAFGRQPRVQPRTRRFDGCR